MAMSDNMRDMAANGPMIVGAQPRVLGDDPEEPMDETPEHEAETQDVEEVEDTADDDLEDTEETADADVSWETVERFLKRNRLTVVPEALLKAAPTQPTEEATDDDDDDLATLKDLKRIVNEQALTKVQELERQLQEIKLRPQLRRRADEQARKAIPAEFLDYAVPYLESALDALDVEQLYSVSKDVKVAQHVAAIAIGQAVRANRIPKGVRTEGTGTYNQTSTIPTGLEEEARAWNAVWGDVKGCRAEDIIKKYNLGAR